MSRQNKSFYALLGILISGPATGYEIKQIVETRLSHFWSESFGQIYPNLKKLVEEGLATVETKIQIGKPNKNIYSITDKGRIVLTEWLMNPIKNLPPEKNEFLLKIYFGNNVPLEQNLKHIYQHKQMMVEITQMFTHLENSMQKNNTGKSQNMYGLLTLKYGQTIVNSIIDWCNESIGLLESQNEGGK